MGKINLIFDIKIFIDSFFAKNSCRSGVYFVAWNVLNIMRENKELNITLAYPAEYENTDPLGNIKNEPFFSQFQFGCAGFGLEYLSLSQKIKKHRENKNYIRMCYNYLRMTKLKLKEYSLYRKKCFKNADIYFSPYYAIPQKIVKQKRIKKFYILYDAIPAILPEYTGIDTYSQVASTLNKNTYAFCISQSCKDDFLKYCGDKLDQNKMFVTHIATNQIYIPNYNKQKLIQVLGKYNVSHNPDDKYLFSLCTLEPRKNIQFTITAFLKFIEKHNAHDLYFYLGGGAWEGLASVMAETLNKFGEHRYKIKMLGYVDDSDLNVLYSNSLFFPFLSQYEGFGMPPLEAMQAGTPVITSNNSSLPEVVGDAAITVTYNDEDAVIKAFEDFYFNEKLREEYIAKGLERAKMFSWEKCVGQMMEVMYNVPLNAASFT